MADAEVNPCEAQCQEKIVNTNVYKNWYSLFLNGINAAYGAFWSRQATVLFAGNPVTRIVDNVIKYGAA